MKRQWTAIAWVLVGSLGCVSAIGRPPCVHADLDGDGLVDLRDFAIFAACLEGEEEPTPSPTPTPTPEPTPTPTPEPRDRLIVNLTPTSHSAEVNANGRKYVQAIPIVGTTELQRGQSYTWDSRHDFTNTSLIAVGSGEKPQVTIKARTGVRLGDASAVGIEFIGTGSNVGIEVHGKALIIDCKITNFRTGVGTGTTGLDSPWIVRTEIAFCVDYAAYIPSTNAMVVASILRDVGGAVLRFPHFVGCAVVDSTLARSARRPLIKAHAATRFGAFSSDLLVDNCTFIGASGEGNYLLTAVTQNPGMREDVRDVVIRDCDFTGAATTKICVLAGGQNIKVSNCSGDMTASAALDNWFVVCEKQGESPFGPVLIESCTQVGADQLVRNTTRFQIPDGVTVK